MNKKVKKCFMEFLGKLADALSDRDQFSKDSGYKERAKERKVGG